MLFTYRLPGSKAENWLAARQAHVAGDGGGGGAAVDDEVVALGFAGDRFKDGGVDIAVFTEDAAQVRGIVLA